MKTKLLLPLLALLALMLTACVNATAKADRQPQNHPYMSRIYFDGHYYIAYDAGGRVSSPSILHDPDYPCHKKGGVEE